MARKFLIFAIGFVLFIACADSNPTGFSGITTETNDVAENGDSAKNGSMETTNGTVIDVVELSSAKAMSSASQSLATSSTAAFSQKPLTDAELAVIDSILSSLDGNAGFAQNHDSIQSPMTSSTAYEFKTMGQDYYNQSQCSVRLYENENGTQLYSGVKRGNFLETSLVMESRKVFLRMVSNNYWGGDIVENCRADSMVFRQNCEIQSGVFRNYSKEIGCESAVGTLQMACAMPIPENTPAQKLLKDEAERYKQKCNLEAIKEPVCSTTCDVVDGLEFCSMSCL